MNIHRFESEFINDLESFIKTPIQFVPLGVWNQCALATPERHLANAAAENIYQNTAIHLLETQNYHFELISSFLNIPIVFNGELSIDPIKEQIWLFGYKWMKIYYDLLSSASIYNSEFYRCNHDKFMNLLTQMCISNPLYRSSFEDALKFWIPNNHLFAFTDDGAGVFGVDAMTSEIGDMPQPPPTDNPAKTPHVPSKRRLILIARSNPAERNKTRRNHGNLDRSLPNGNRGKLILGRKSVA